MQPPRQRRIPQLKLISRRANLGLAGIVSVLCYWESFDLKDAKM
jgi:hypothetical protein